MDIFMPEFTNINCLTCFYVGFNKSSWQERAEGDNQHLLSTSYIPGTLHAAFHLALQQHCRLISCVLVSQIRKLGHRKVIFLRLHT